MHHLGLTRSANRRDHLLLTPDTFIRTPLPGLTNGSAIVHVAPQTGAGFSMTTVEFEPGGALAQGPVQRLVFVLEGEISLFEPDSETPHSLGVDGYAYCPQGFGHSLRAETKSRVVLVEKIFQPLDQEAARGMVAKE